MRRAAEERAAANRATEGARTGTPGSAFGASGDAGAAADFDPANLPPGFEKFLGR
jgi:signal recognition particle subunit SRP54